MVDCFGIIYPVDQVPSSLTFTLISSSFHFRINEPFLVLSDQTSVELSFHVPAISIVSPFSNGESFFCFFNELNSAKLMLSTLLSDFLTFTVLNDNSGAFISPAQVKVSILELPPTSVAIIIKVCVDNFSVFPSIPKSVKILNSFEKLFV